MSEAEPKAALDPLMGRPALWHVKKGDRLTLGEIYSARIDGVKIDRYLTPQGVKSHESFMVHVKPKKVRIMDDSVRKNKVKAALIRAAVYKERSRPLISLIQFTDSNGFQVEFYEDSPFHYTIFVENQLILQTQRSRV